MWVQREDGGRWSSWSRLNSMGARKTRGRLLWLFSFWFGLLSVKASQEDVTIRYSTSLPSNWQTKLRIYKATVDSILFMCVWNVDSLPDTPSNLKSFSCCLHSTLKCQTLASLKKKKKAKQTSNEAMIIKVQLRWTGHFIRKGGNRLLKRVLYGELRVRKHRKAVIVHASKIPLSNFSTCMTQISITENTAKGRLEWRPTIS